MPACFTTESYRLRNSRGRLWGIENISDGARWVAYCRAIESERSDALFRDEFAFKLAGTRGEAIAQQEGNTPFIARGLAVRTAVFDALILERIATAKIDLVLNLAAGLDARPWRMPLPQSLRWIDVDLPRILDYKTTILKFAKPNCHYSAVPADLTKQKERASMFSRINQDAANVLVITEGFLVYLSNDQVAALARDLYGCTAFKWWLTDITGPMALEALKRIWGPMFREGGAEFQFGPKESTGFFRPFGWHEEVFRSSREEARRLKRPMPMSQLTRLLLWFSTAERQEEFRRLSGVALLRRGTQ